jgi:DNA-binding response OmpR family regulator
MADANILAVDDENDILLIVKTALESEGFRVETAPTGDDALTLVESYKPDCIILDMMMPGLTGLETLSGFRGKKNTAATPVIMLTGVSERKKILESLNRGVSYYIVKPFECDELISKVRSALREAEQPVE